MKNLFKILVVASAFALSGCSATLQRQAKTAAVSDATTTAVALSSGAIEHNPFGGTSPVGILVFTAAKIALVDYLAQDKTEQGNTNLKILTGLWGGATINNLAVIAGASNPVALVAGVISGLILFTQETPPQLTDIQK